MLGLPARMGGGAGYRSLVLTVVFLLSACGGMAPDRIDGLRPSSKNAGSEIMVVAHRSCWRLAPENSLAAMDKCIALGVDMLEIDVRKSKDGKLVIIHDETVDRTTQFSGPVTDFTLKELTGFRLKEGAGGKDSPLSNSRMPSLEQVLSHLKGRVLINLDVKKSLREEVMAVVRDRKLSDQVIVKAVVGAPDAPLIKNASYLEWAHFMPIIKEKNGGLAEQIARFHTMRPVAFEVIYSAEEDLREACLAAKNQNARCWVNTMWERLSPGHSDDISIRDPDSHWGHLISLGVNMFQTDRPQELMEYLSAKGLR